MCTFYCALIVCTLVSTAITTNTNTVGSNGRTFDSREVTIEEKFTNWYFIPTEWIQPTNEDCKYGDKCYDKEKVTTTTTIFEQLSEKKRWDQERHMSETMMSDVEEQSKKSKKWKLQQKILEMESDRLKTILDILNSQ